MLLKNPYKKLPWELIFVDANMKAPYHITIKYTTIEIIFDYDIILFWKTPEDLYLIYEILLALNYYDYANPIIYLSIKNKEYIFYYDTQDPKSITFNDFFNSLKEEILLKIFFLK